MVKAKKHAPLQNLLNAHLFKTFALVNTFSYAHDWPSLVFFIPIYGENGGNETLIALDDQKKQTIYCAPYRTKTVLENLGKQFSLSVPSLRKNCGNIICRCNNVPLVLHPSLILLPVKVRNPLTKDDGATGYVVYNKVKDFIKNPDNTKKKTRIIFGNGLYLDTTRSLGSMFRLKGEALTIEDKLTGLKAPSSPPLNPSGGQPNKPEAKRMDPFTVKILKQATDLLTIATTIIEPERTRG